MATIYEQHEKAFSSVAAYVIAKDGQKVATVALKYPKDGAGILSSIVRSDGFAVIDESLAEIAPGDPIEFLPFSEVFG